MIYRIVLAHSDQEALAQDLTEAIFDVLQGTMEVENLIEVATEISEESIPQVVAYLASETGRKDPNVNDVLQVALDTDVSIVPVVKHGEDENVEEKLPPNLLHLNTVVWYDNGFSVPMSLLRILGLVEVERKVFISYRRSETSELATQLHTMLVQRGFDVFLDRFSVDPGEEFQLRLEEDLGDKAFVLLLESDGLQESKWVRHEITFALANRMGFLALNLPDCTNIVPTIDEAFRTRLAQQDLTSHNVLSSEALSRTLDAIEIAHAHALRRRREQILGSVTEKLRTDGCQCQPVDDWCVLATSPETRESGLFWVTPRRPVLTDFHRLCVQYDRITEKGHRNLKGSVIHDVKQLAEGYVEVMNWLASLSGKGMATIENCSL